MKLYKLSQTVNNDYDTFDSCIVAAESEDTAKLINPDAYSEWGHKYTSWAYSPDDVKVEYIGEAKEGTEKGIILASFNAG